MREETDGNVVYFPPELALVTLMMWFKKFFSLFLPLTWRVNKYISRRETVEIGEMKVQI